MPDDLTDRLSVRFLRQWDRDTDSFRSSVVCECGYRDSAITDSGREQMAARFRAHLALGFLQCGPSHARTP